MTESVQTRGLIRSNKARLVVFARWVVVVAAAPLLLIILVAWTPPDRLAAFERLGLLQPPIAALVALLVVLSMRFGWGRFEHETRKGARSASSATIAVRLWMACFALLLVAMLLSAHVARLADRILDRPEPGKAAVVRVDVETGAAAPSVSVRVNR